MDVIDIILFHDGLPLWILDFLLDSRNLLLVCKDWRKRLLSCDAYCNQLMKKSWWFEGGVMYNYELNYKSTRKKFTHKNYELARKVYHELAQRMANKLYLVSTEHVDTITKCHYNVGYVFSLETKHITKYWSGFNLGQSRLGSLRNTVECLKSHLFIEIPSDRKYCRTFVRDEESRREFFIRNMFDGDVVKYWYYGAFPTVNPASLLKRIIQ